ncbi:hypothetical protein Q4F19_10060 [Sphingomonas sp. BIUV-7]|uniref:Uncharacterized protein n=1 Tax=Sphingomonas natans TaxID=3063330 RepID=A0ABT8Y8R8_9SPHN|nr:hypothetical protein [Sphingomonas sp. BIUV-7]MDO6414723.1 hypothetical protein [Sphingomonas sp. BIUV-7]
MLEDLGLQQGLKVTGFPQKQDAPGFLVEPSRMRIARADVVIIAIMTAILARNANAERRRDREVERALDAGGIIIAVLRIDIAAGSVELRKLRIDEDRAAGRIGPDQRPLRAAQDLDARYIVKRAGGHDRRLEDAVRIGRDAIGDRRRARRETDAPDIGRLDQSPIGHAQRRGRELQIGKSRDRLFRESARGQCRCRDRQVLQVFGPALRGDYDFRQSVR